MEKLAHILIYISGMLWGIELIPQLIRTYKTKKVKDISILFFVLCFIAYICYFIANTILKNWSIVIAHIPSMICLVLMLIMLVKYRSN